MENEKLIFSTNKKLRINFYSWFFALLFSAVIVFIVNIPIAKLEVSLAISLQQVLILSMLGGIPGILYWSKTKIQNLADISDIDKRLKLYSKYVLIRQSVFFILGFFALIMHVLTIMNGALILFMVVIGLCVFIAPSKGRLETEAFLFKPELEPETESESEDESEEAEETEQSEELKSDVAPKAES